MSLRTIAIDWSGAVSGAAERIWLAEVENGAVTRLESGRSRDAIVAFLRAEASRSPDLIVGFDFAFSFPAWYLRERSIADAPELWNIAAEEGEAWLRDCAPPFWGRPGRGRPALPEHFRRTDQDAPATGGIRPKSVFQIGGAGAVGTGSIRGMPALKQLRDAGFAIWPFDAPRFPLAVEIYPRTLTGAVVKSDPIACFEYLQDRYPGLDSSIRERASQSEDAFDALVSALVMNECASELASLPVPDDPTVRLEGRIWLPQTTAKAPVTVSSAAHRMTDYTVRPIGHVVSPLTEASTVPRQPDEGAPAAFLHFDERVLDALSTLSPGDEIILLTWLHRADRGTLRVHPRGDLSRPQEGVFSTRSPHRPNPIGLHRIEITAIDGARIQVRNLEALDGTPILDVKPVLGEIER